MDEIIVVDTDILIDADRGVEKARLFLDNLSLENVIAISEITSMEIIVGCNNKNELLKAEKYLDQFFLYKSMKQFLMKQSVC